MQALRLVSYLASNMADFYTAIGAAFSRACGLDYTFEQATLDPMDDPDLTASHIDCAFICGLPFSRLASAHPGKFVILAAPVMELPRYEDSPVYFADMIVKSDSPIHSFADLAGKTLCYNGRKSNSGYNLLRYQMLEWGLTAPFFGRTFESGSHQQSIRLVVGGQADCSAVDSTVLEQEQHNSPELSEQLRVCASLGPSPMPPVVASTRLGNSVLACLQTALVEPDSELREAMQPVAVRRFTQMRPEDYAVLPEMEQIALRSGFAVIP